MGGENFEELGVHERFAADDAEEDIAHLLSIGDQLVHRLQVDDLLFGGDIDPATLAAQITAIDDGDVKKWREDFAPSEPLLMLLDGQYPLKAHVPGQLPEEPLVRLEEKPFGHPEIHAYHRSGNLVRNSDTT